MSERTEGEGRHLDLVTMGCRWRLDVTALDAADARAMAERWGRCRELASGTVLLDGDPMTVVAATGAAPYDLSREVTRRGLQRLTGRATLLHAAALADEGGRTLVLVASSGGGKSTATRVLGRHLGYVSDESVVLLDDHRIAPHPKPPSLVVDPERRFRKEEPAPDELGLGATPAAPRLGRLLTLARDPGVVTPSIQPVGLIDQVLAVLPETSSTWLLPDGLHRLARAVTSGGPPARLRYSEIDSCHDLVREHLEGPEVPAPEWEHLPPSAAERWTDADAVGAGDPVADGEVAASAEGAAGRSVGEAPGEELTGSDVLVRVAWSDAIAADGEVLVLAGSRPLRLAGPGAALWRAAAGGRSVDALTADVVAALGDHPDAGALVRDAAAELLRHGALRRALR